MSLDYLYNGVQEGCVLIGLCDVFNAGNGLTELLSKHSSVFKKIMALCLQKVHGERFCDEFICTDVDSFQIVSHGSMGRKQYDRNVAGREILT